jgi:hypothetical protein
MTFREALELGILVREQRSDDKQPRLTTLDGKFALWYDERRPMPFRWALADQPVKPEISAATEGQRHGGAMTLENAMRITVLLRSSGADGG